MDGRVDAALDRWSFEWGANRVLRRHDAAPYGRTTLASAPQPVGVVRPRSVEDVVDIVRTASELGVALYPISLGKNWGWGDACPPTDGQVVLDLSGLDRIIEVDADLGYAVVEPGVTQEQLSRYLADHTLPWWLDITCAGGNTSVLGNLVDRGLAQGAYGDRARHACGMEVVLSDGTVLETGFGHFPNSTVGHVAPWGVGPSLEGLFAQSNLGVVTKAGVWLIPATEHFRVYFYSVPERRFPELVDRLRPLRLCGTLSTNVHNYFAPTPDGGLWWAFGALYGGTEATVAAHQAELEAATSEVTRLLVVDAEWLAQDDAPHRVVDALGLPTLFVDAFADAARPLTGAPLELSPLTTLAFFGGPAIQGVTGPPASGDPLDNGYGAHFLWPVCPMRGSDLARALNRLREVFDAYRIPFMATVQLLNGRCIVIAARIVFNRDDPERADAARGCYRAGLAAMIDAGFPPWRVPVDAMDQVVDGSAHWHAVARLKAALDPAGILAPGRYAPLPADRLGAT